MSKTLDMARASHLDLYGLGKGHMDFLDALRRFEDLVRADQSEIDAKIADDLTKHSFLGRVGEAIRARGTA